MPWGRCSPFRQLHPVGNPRNAWWWAHIPLSSDAACIWGKGAENDVLLPAGCRFFCRCRRKLGKLEKKKKKDVKFAERKELRGSKGGSSATQKGRGKEQQGELQQKGISCSAEPAGA